MKYKYQQSQDLTAYWNFDTNSSSQVGSFNGTDTAMSYTAGKFSNAATFNGTTSKIVIADNASLKPTGEFTHILWFKSSTTGTDKLLYQSWSGNTNWAGYRIAINTSSQAYFNIGNNTSSAVLPQITGTTNLCDGSWHMVAVSYRNNYAQVYVDGKLDASGYMPTPAYAATNYVRYGVFNNTGTDTTFMTGQIDDAVLINGYALDADTILAQYNAQAAQGTGNITVNKKALITAVAPYAAGVTPITIWGGTDYSLQNATISSPYYATVSQPFGFNRNPAKWTVEVSNKTFASQSPPTGGTWYNLGSQSISVPIGNWSLESEVDLQLNAGGTGGNNDLSVTLSTANNTESDSDLTGCVSGTISTTGVFSGHIFRKKPFMNVAKTTLYLNSKCATTIASTTLYNSGANSPTIIRAVSTLI
jgi:hypothetical protein